MSNTSPNLGNVITSAAIRKYVYGIYSVAALIVGGAAAYFLGIAQPIPELVTGAQAVIAYLAIPVGALALANTSTATATEYDPKHSA
jgi:xanthine/uracil permease